MGGRGSASGLIPPGSAKKGQVDAMGFSDTDNSAAHQLQGGGRNYYQQQDFSIDTEMALKDYVADQATPGSLYSPSQNLNYKLKKDPTGGTLTANEKFMRDSIQDGMHNLGQNLQLTRYARVDFMQNLGVGNFSNMSAAQLKAALVGKPYDESGFISTSYNDFAKAPNGGRPFTDKAVKIVYDTPASTQALMAPTGPGGNLGEVILDSNRAGQSYQITDVNFTGKSGRSGSSYYNQIELKVKVIPG